MYNNKSRSLALFVVVFTLILSIPTFGQTPDVAPQTRETLPISPPSTNTVAAPPSLPPPGEKEQDAVLQAVSDVAKAAIEANKVTMDTTATFYRERAEQDSRFFTITTTLIGAFVVLVVSVGAFFGVQSYQSLASRFSKELDDEVRKFTSIIEQAQSKATMTLQAKVKNTDAMISINLVVSEPNLPTAQKEGLYSEALRSLEESLKINGAVEPRVTSQ